MKILLWSPTGSGEHYGGPANYSYRLYRAKTSDIDLTLAHGTTHQEEYDLFSKQVFIRPYATDHLSQYKYLRASKTWITKNIHRFDLFHGMSGFHCTMLPALHAIEYGIPTIIFIINAHLDLADKPSIFKKIMALPARRRKIAKRIHAFVAMSSEIEEELVSYGIDRQRIYRIPNFVNTTRFQPFAEKAELRRLLEVSDLPTICFSGELSIRKRPHLLLEAGREIAKEQPIQILLAGPARDRKYYDHLVSLSQEITNLGGEVRFLGFRKDIERVLQVSDVFCLPSANEGMPGALVEAQATGLPCVVTEFSGAFDVIGHSKPLGQIVTPCRYEIAEAITHFLQSADSCRSICRAHALEKFSRTRIWHAHLEMFHNVCAEH